MKAKKVLAVALSAVLFGALAGGTMVGINVMAENVIPGLSQLEEIQESSPETAPEAGETETQPASESGKETGSQTAADVLDVSDIVEEAMPSVVSITNKMVIQQQGYGSIFDYFYGGGVPQEYMAEAAGSGVIVKQTGDELLIVTNNHVVEDASEISVTFIDGETVDAAIKGTDSTMDLAIVAVKLSDMPEGTMDKIKGASLHDTEDLKPGQGVIAIGNALGFGQSVTVGYISALDREITTEEGTNSNLIQVDAAINPGNSGGALLNMEGELIGINVAKVADSKVEGVGYAIPIYKAMNVIDNLSNAKTKVAIPEDQQGRLGVYVNTVDAQVSKALNMPEGVLVVGFDNEDGKTSAAEEAGIKMNDIITKFDGQGVSTAEELTGLVKYYEAGSTVTVTVQRLEDGSYKEQEIQVTLGANPDANAQTQPESQEDEQMQGADNPNGDIYDLFRNFLEQYQN